MQKTLPLLHFLTLHRSLLSSFAHPPIHFHRLKNDCGCPSCFITKEYEKHFVFGNFDFFGCFRNRKFLYPEKGGKDGKDENVVLSCSSCLQKNYGRFCYKRQLKQL